MDELRTDPNDFYAERWIISCLFIDQRLFFDLKVSEHDLFYKDNIDMMIAISNCVKWWKTIDIINVWSELKHINESLIQQLPEIISELYVASWFYDYNNQVKVCSIQRNAIKKCNEIIYKCYSGASAMEIASSTLSIVSDDSLSEDVNYFDEAIASYWQWITPIASYWYDLLDQITWWIHEWRFVIIWAWTHVWKTLFSTFISKNIAMSWTKIGYVTFEMLWKEIADRIISSACWVWYERYSKTAQELNINPTTIETLKNNVEITFKCRSIDDVLLFIRKCHVKNWTKVFFIDHLWLISQTDKRTRNEFLWYCTSSLKSLSLELWICIICLCQINRASSKEDKEPRMHDLRDSGNIEQDSDVVIILHRNKDDDGKMDNSMKMNVLKNRVTGQINYCIAEIVGEVFTLK